MDNLPDALYLQYIPDAPSSLSLQSIQQNIADTSVTGRLVKPDQLHMTVLHFGYTDVVLQQLRAVQPQLALAAYSDAVRLLQEYARSFMPQRLIVTATALSLFGPYASTLALQIDTNPELQELQRQTRQAVYRFFRACGLPGNTKLAHMPRGFQVSETYHPHITLMKNMHDTSAINAYQPQSLIIDLNAYPV